MNLEAVSETYQMSPAAAELVCATKLLIVAGVVSAGKNTVTDKLVDAGKYHRIVTYTTRAPRTNHGVMEVDGEDYHFIDRAELERMVQNQELIEFKYTHGNFYGTGVAELQKARSQGKTPIMDIDVKGTVEYLAIKPDTHAVFLLPPSAQVWLERLEKRYGNLDDHSEELTKRFRTAYDEINHIQADKRFVLVVNDDLETTAERLQGVVDGTIERTSDYAEEITEHLLHFLEKKI